MRPPAQSTRTYALLPYTTLVRSTVAAVPVLVADDLPAAAEAAHRPAAVVASAEVHSDSDDLAAPTSTVTDEVEATTPPTTVPAETTTTAAPATTTTTDAPADPEPAERQTSTLRDRKSTRLNSSH